MHAKLYFENLNARPLKRMRSNDDRIRMFINVIKCEGDVGLLMTTKQFYVWYGCKLCTLPRTVRKGDEIVQAMWRIHADWTIC